MPRRIVAPATKFASTRMRARRCSHPGAFARAFAATFAREFRTVPQHAPWLQQPATPTTTDRARPTNARNGNTQAPQTPRPTDATPGTPTTFFACPLPAHVGNRGVTHAPNHDIADEIVHLAATARAKSGTTDPRRAVRAASNRRARKVCHTRPQRF